MHENDHLNGVLFIDRLTAKKRKEIEPALKAVKSKYN
jgi:peptide deformylase